MQTGTPIGLPAPSASSDRTAHPTSAPRISDRSGIQPGAASRRRRIGVTSEPTSNLAMARFHHNVYVVELSREVLSLRRFVRCNPDYRPGMPCVYVGMTGLEPDERFDKHKAGVRSNSLVRRYGLRLLPELYACYNPMPYEAAREMEVELAIGLQELGYGVWQA